MIEQRQFGRGAISDATNSVFSRVTDAVHILEVPSATVVATTGASFVYHHQKIREPEGSDAVHRMSAERARILIDNWLRLPFPDS